MIVLTWTSGSINIKNVTIRAAGVPLETRKVLLGHKNGDITSHYSAPELAELIEAANRVCGGESRKSPTVTVLKRKAG